MHHLRFIITRSIVLCSVCFFIQGCRPTQQKLSTYQEPFVLSQELSNANISAFVQDPQGYLWIATARGINRFDGQQYTVYLHNPDLPGSIIYDQITCLHITSDSTLWIGTPMGLDSHTPNGTGFRHHTEIPKHYILDIAGRNNDTLWIATAQGLGCLFPRDSVYHHISDQHEPARDLLPLHDNRVCFLQGNKLMIYSPQEDRCQVLLNLGIPSTKHMLVKGFNPQTAWVITQQGIVEINLSDGTSLPIVLPEIRHARPQALYPTQNGILIRTEKSLWKIDRFTREISPIKEFQTCRDQMHLITDIFTDKQSNIWVGSFESGYQVIPHHPSFFCPDPTLTSCFKGRFVTRITGNHRDKLWVGTRYDGLFQYDKLTGKCQQIIDPSQPPFHQTIIRGLLLDSSERLWVSTNQKILCYSTTGSSLHLLHSIALSRCNNIYEDRIGNIWFSFEDTGIQYLPAGYPAESPLAVAFQGVYKDSNITSIEELNSGGYLIAVHIQGLLYARTPTDRPIPFPDPQRSSDPAFKTIITQYEDRKGNLWFGSYSHGLLRYTPEDSSITRFDIRKNLPSNDILALTEDHKGHLWITTSFGLSNYSPSTGEFINYFASDGIMGSQFHEKALFKEQNGTLYMGGNQGLTFFNPSRQPDDTTQIPLLINRLMIYNQPVCAFSRETSEKHRPETFPEGITLKYDQDNFSIDFSGIDFISSDNLIYSYRLTGFDEEWSLPGKNRRATFSHVPAGKYLFEVNVRNREGIWNTTPVQLPIHILKAPWYTHGAIAGYILLILGISFGAIRLLFKLHFQQVRLNIERRKQAEIRAINQMKMSFLARLSHELKTPLTLIYGPLTLLKEDSDFPTTYRSHLNRMERNAREMFHKVNQMIEFGKMDSDILELHLSSCDIISLCRSIIQTFSELAAQKEFSIRFTPFTDCHITIVDREKFEKILGNLLSNAIKFTPYQGEDIEIQLDRADEATVTSEFQLASPTNIPHLIIRVIDKGIGISKQKYPHLFDCFSYSVQESGNGIGLSYAYRLTSLHKGYITAVPNPYGKGVIFSFSIPDTQTVYSQKEIMNISETPNPFSSSPEYPIESTVRKTDEKIDCLLIITSHPDLQGFLYDLLEPYYKILQAHNGEDGLLAAQQEIPNLIICDVPMPGMNGYQLCSALKQDPTTCHIPVLMLTDKNRIEERIYGMKMGADIYLTQPFTPGLLRASIENLLNNRRRIFQTLSTSENRESSDSSSLSEPDMQWLKGLSLKLDKMIGNTDFNINDLAEEMHLSRTSFYRKIKRLTGYSPNDFVRIYRLQKASEYIITGELSLAEIADRTGFSTPSHFSSVFKRHYGISPRQYRGHPATKEKGPNM